jgi:hypothetical protein
MIVLGKWDTSPHQRHPPLQSRAVAHHPAPESEAAQNQSLAQTVQSGKKYEWGLRLEVQD